MPPSHREEAETHEARAACPGHTASERGAVTLTGVRLHGHAVLDRTSLVGNKVEDAELECQEISSEENFQVSLAASGFGSVNFRVHGGSST